jgi:hypothetical protein
VLADDRATWPDKLHLVGFTDDALHKTPTVSAKPRLSWLRRDPGGYAPQPYEQLVPLPETLARFA